MELKYKLMNKCEWTKKNNQKIQNRINEHKHSFKFNLPDLSKFAAHLLNTQHPFRPLNNMSRAHSPTFPSLHLRYNSFSNPSVALPTSQLILQPFPCFTYVTVQSPTLPLFHLRHSSVSNHSIASPTSQVLLILQPFRLFTYITTHSPTLPSLHPRHSSLSNPSVASPTSQLILQPFCCYTYVTAHYPTLPLLHLHHSSLSNPSFASPMSQEFHLRYLVSRPCCHGSMLLQF